MPGIGAKRKIRFEIVVVVYQYKLIGNDRFGDADEVARQFVGHPRQLARRAIESDLVATEVLPIDDACRGVEIGGRLEPSKW